MSKEATAVAAAPATEATDGKQLTITQELTQAFARMEADANVENVETDPEAPSEDTEDAEAQPEESPTEDQSASDEEETEETEDDAEKPESEEEDDDKPAGKLKVLTPEEIEEKFNRSNTKEARAYMKEVSALADARGNTITALGGEPFIEPLTKISAAMQNPTPETLINFFVGVTEGGGAEVMVDILAQAMYMGFEKADEWAQNPATAGFAESIQHIVDVAVKSKFGTSVAELQKMAEWQKVGWFDKLDEWIANNYVPQTELDEMLELNANPTLRRQAERIRELEQGQREQKTEASPRIDSEEDADTPFGEFVADKISHTLSDVVWASSPLRDLKADSVEIKEQKAFLRDVLMSDAIKEFHKLPAAAKLLADFRQGKGSTSVYITKLTEALDAMLTVIEPRMLTAEKNVAQLYGTTRNGQLKAKETAAKTTATNGAKPAPPAQPTVPTDFGPKPGEPKSMLDIRKELESAFAEAG